MRDFVAAEVRLPITCGWSETTYYYRVYFRISLAFLINSEYTFQLLLGSCSVSLPAHLMLICWWIQQKISNVKGEAFSKKSSRAAIMKKSFISNYSHLSGPIKLIQQTEIESLHVRQSHSITLTRSFITCLHFPTSWLWRICAHMVWIVLRYCCW